MNTIQFFKIRRFTEMTIRKLWYKKWLFQNTQTLCSYMSFEIDSFEILSVNFSIISYCYFKINISNYSPSEIESCITSKVHICKWIFEWMRFSEFQIGECAAEVESCFEFSFKRIIISQWVLCPHSMQGKFWLVHIFHP